MAESRDTEVRTREFIEIVPPAPIARAEPLSLRAGSLAGSKLKSAPNAQHRILGAASTVTGNLARTGHGLEHDRAALFQGASAARRVQISGVDEPIR